MKKHEKKRLKGIKEYQKVAKTVKKVANLVLSADPSKLDGGIELYIVNSLSNKQLKQILAHPKRFNAIPELSSALEKAVTDELFERTAKLES